MLTTRALTTSDADQFHWTETRLITELSHWWSNMSVVTVHQGMKEMVTRVEVGMVWRLLVRILPVFRGQNAIAYRTLILVKQYKCGNCPPGYKEDGNKCRFNPGDWSMGGFLIWRLRVQTLSVSVFRVLRQDKIYSESESNVSIVIFYLGIEEMGKLVEKAECWYSERVEGLDPTPADIRKRSDLVYQKLMWNNSI